MSNGNQGSVNQTSTGGRTAEHPSVDPVQPLVGPSTDDQLNTINFPPVPIACFFIDDVRFAFDSSFVDADCSGGGDVTEDIRVEFTALASLMQAHAGCPLSIFGHADPVGTDVYNKSLSERRARAIYALLIFQSEPDTAVGYWQDIASAENWGSNQRQTMQNLTGLAAGTDDSTLFKSYMQTLSKPAPNLSKTDFLAQGADADRKGDFQGCSEFNPLLIFSQKKQTSFDQAAQNGDAQGIADRNRQNAPNRRVLGLIFRKGTIVDPTQWPCPRATEGISDCQDRFWSDGEKRRSTHLPDADRKFEDKKDTFACRFYQRLAGTSPCDAPKDPTCWPHDYEREINQQAYKRYYKKYHPNGTEVDPILGRFAGKISVPAKTGGKITVELRFKVQVSSGVTSSDADSAKSKLENGVATNWNGKFTLEANDPLCGKKTFPIEFKVAWVTSGQNYIIQIHQTFPREGVNDPVMDVSKTTTDWTYAHEFGHCFGLPDEYSYEHQTQTVKYVKPDGTLDVAVTAPFDGKSPTAPDATIMAAVDNTTILPRHAFPVGMEVQKLLTDELGRTITCTITMS